MINTLQRAASSYILKGAILQRHLIGVIIESTQFWHQLNLNLNNIFKESSYGLSVVLQNQPVKYLYLIKRVNKISAYALLRYLAVYFLMIFTNY